MRVSADTLESEAQSDSFTILGDSVRLMFADWFIDPRALPIFPEVLFESSRIRIGRVIQDLSLQLEIVKIGANCVEMW